MAQHDYVIANQGFPAFRSDLNDALAAIVSNNSGATEPTTMFAHQMWVDTAANPSILKIRNADNDAWITLGTIDQTGDTFTLTSAVSATTLNTSGAVVFNDAGADVDFRVEGDTDANLLFVDASADAVGIGTSSPFTNTSRTTLTVDSSGAGGGEIDLGVQGNKAVRFLTDGSYSLAINADPNNSAASSAIYFSVDNTERMRLTSGGALFVGATSFFGSPKLGVSGSSTDNNVGVSTITNTNTTDAACIASFITGTNSTATSNTLIHFLMDNGNSAQGRINANGASQAAFGSYSDRRLKENITDLPSQLKNICALRPVEFDYIQSEGGGHQIGFIAQEMQEVYPDVVGDRGDGMLTVTGWDKTTARLVAAIQELKAELDTVKAELATLKG